MFLHIGSFLIEIYLHIQAAASCYIDLIVKESDNNVKLIVLDRLIKLKENPAHEKVLQVCYCSFLVISYYEDFIINDLSISCP